MTDLTTEANRLLALAEKATPGPWFSHVGDYVWTADLKHCITCNGPDGICLTSGDAEFIAASHDMADCIRKLLAENEALRKDAERLEFLGNRCVGASDSERYLPFRIYWKFKGIRAAIDSAMTEVKK